MRTASLFAYRYFLYFMGRGRDCGVRTERLLEVGLNPAQLSCSQQYPARRLATSAVRPALGDADCYIALLPVLFGAKLSLPYRIWYGPARALSGWQPKLSWGRHGGAGSVFGPLPGMGLASQTERSL